MRRTMKGVAALVLVAGVGTGVFVGSAGASTRTAAGSLCPAVKKYVALVTKARGAADAVHAQRYARDTYKILKEIKTELPKRFGDDVDLLREAYKAAQGATSVDDYLTRFSPEAYAAAGVIGKYVSKRCDIA